MAFRKLKKSYALVPNVVGLVDTDAATKLGQDSLALAVGSDCQTSHTPEEGKVVRTSPVAGTLVTRGTPVTIFVRVFRQVCFHFVLPNADLLKRMSEAAAAKARFRP